MSPVDFKCQRLLRNEARKLVARLAQEGRVRFSNHAFDRMKERGIDLQDALNVLESPASRIEKDGELEKGSYRYRLSTNRFIVVLGFSSDGGEIIVLTVIRRMG